MQLDIFAHSRDIMLRNDVAAALERRDAAAAQAAWQALVDEYPEDAQQAALAALTHALQGSGGGPLPDHAALRTARMQLGGPLQVAAAQVFGVNAATTWLAPLWRDLAQRAAALPWRADCPQEHAGALWLRAADPTAAAAAVERIESWRRIPAPLGWMAEARYRTHGLDAAWPLLAELAWLAPRRLEDVMTRLADPLLQRLRDHFDAGFDSGAEDTPAHDTSADLAWLPAWALVERPALASVLATAEPGRHTPAEQALRLMVELLGLEHQGRHHDLVQRRKQLRDLQPSLYQTYMASR